MTNMFWNKWNDEFRGYGEPNNNYNQNANHQVSNNSNSYNSWSNNWGTQKQNNTSWDWNYFNDELKQEKKRPNPAKSFNPQEFLNTEFMNDFRASGKKTTYADMNGAKNTDWKKTSYSTQEGLTTTATGINVTNNPNVKLVGNSYKWHDSEYGYVDIYAMNINQLKESAKGGVYTSPYYGSIIEVEDSNGNISYGAILDACGQASKEAILDKFTKNTEPNNEYISWSVKRKGFASKDEDQRW